MIIYDRYLSYKTKNTPVQREYFCILCLYKILCDILCKWLKMLISWRRHPDSNRGSEFCRLVPYHLAISPFFRRTREKLLANEMSGFFREIRSNGLMVLLILKNQLTIMASYDVEQVTGIGPVT